MALNSKQKGKKGELELSHILQKYGYKARRSNQYCGANGDADVVGVFGLHIECKRVERLNIHEAMNQALNDAREGETAVVMHRKNRTPWLVTMTLDDFMNLWKEADNDRSNET